MQNYTIVSIEDTSFAATRVSARIVVDDPKLYENKEEMRRIIPRLNDMMKGFKGKRYEIVHLFLYNTHEQEQHGLPFCRTQWIDSGCKSKPNIISHNEYMEGIYIEWDEMYKHLM